ncbi:MAG: hypothetical protein EHM79_00310 [Geobacter sp.]|nr:MAG: hypothetical protein EHM79_00310 [Geobacter sp.]
MAQTQKNHLFSFVGDEQLTSKEALKKSLLGNLDCDDNRMIGSSNSYDICHIWDNHQEIIRRIVLGQKNVDIARDMNCTEATVSNVRNHPIIRKRIEFLQAMANNAVVDVQKRILEVAAEAQVVLEDIMNNQASAPKLRADVAFGLLDRAGYGPVKNLNVRKQTVPCDQNYMQNLKNKTLEEQRLLRRNSTVVDVETVQNQAQAVDSFVEVESE